MSTDPTEPQGGRERRQSREMSLKRGRPPIEVPGYDPVRFLGVGAYGEVWVARERNTGRQVAIKFYTHRGGLDWSLLSREVEKLAFLFADRYVVQLLAVGWEAEPPYYVMEYLERGSLAERLRDGPLPVGEAVGVFREVAVGLVHAHSKGVLHCDLKPGNVLLDQDGKPRLADFGQSRLSSEQFPALGTLFYMAPEQADLEAVPDARWDVYALGALLHCMLTGSPPHRTKDVVEEFEKTPQLLRRLARYRRLIEESPPPTGHRQVRGVDRGLAEIIDRCLAPDPQRRFPNVQAVLDALDERERRRARRPIVVLATVAPALLLLVMSWFAWRGFSTAVRESDRALTRRALENNRLAAQYVARIAANELDRRWSAVRHMAASQAVKQALAEAVSNAEVAELSEKLSDPRLPEARLEELRREFQRHPARLALEREFAAAIPRTMQAPEEVASWFLCDARGLSLVRLPQPEPESITVGKNFAWRSFFHRGPADMDQSWRPVPEDRLERTKLSAVFRSQASHRWIVAVSTPVFRDTPQQEFLGVVALTIEVGRLVELEGSPEQFAVLVDRRPGANEGVILEHPLFNKLLEEPGAKLPESFKDYRVRAEDLPAEIPGPIPDYTDPLSAAAEGGDYRRQWLAYVEPVRVRGRDIRWAAIVQEDYRTAIGSTLEKLRISLIRYGMVALAMVALVMVVLWKLATRMTTAARS